jgi:GT2 family glycosyltransferase
MSVAIVVPNRNHGRFLAEAIESALAQTGVDLKIAVLDGGSHDDSLDVIHRYEFRLDYWRSVPDGGQAAAVNEGVAWLPNTDYVGWLNADDVLLPNALQKMSGYLDVHGECVAVFGQAHIIDEKGCIIGRFPTRPFSRRALARASIICQPASLIRRRTWDAVGGLDASLQMCLDYDLWWRLCRLGPIGFIPEFVASSRDHEATKTWALQGRMYEEAFALLRRHLGYVPWRWCRSETAYAWRAAHDGRRVRGTIGLARCGSRALARYLSVNGPRGLLRVLRSPQ